MFEIKELKDIETAERIGDFLISPDAFNHEWFPGEKDSVKSAVVESLTNQNRKYFYVEVDAKIIGAIGIRENHCKNGGYEMYEDYFSVHKDYRRQGIASMLLEKIEEYVKQNNGRYIHILTCDIESYKPALAFYESKGYKKVAEIPNYYNAGEGRIDFFKEFSNR